MAACRVIRPISSRDKPAAFFTCFHPVARLSQQVPIKSMAALLLSVRQGFFPSALRVKRGMASLVNPIFQNSIKDVNLLFEILLAGLQSEDEHSAFSVYDEELASLRQTHKLEVIWVDVLPKTLPEVCRLTFALVQGVGALRREDFERTVLTLVYTAQQMAKSSTAHQRDAWAESVIRLYKVIKQDLIR